MIESDSITLEDKEDRINQSLLYYVIDYISYITGEDDTISYFEEERVYFQNPLGSLHTEIQNPQVDKIPHSRNNTILDNCFVPRRYLLFRTGEDEYSISLFEEEDNENSYFVCQIDIQYLNGILYFNNIGRNCESLEFLLRRSIKEYRRDKMLQVKLGS